MPSVHAKAGPSALDRIMRCPGSIRLSEGLPEIASEEAREGRVFHSLMALALQTGFEPHDFVGRYAEADEGKVMQYNEEMAECGKQGLEFLRNFQKSPNWKCLVEKRVDLTCLAEGQFGTSDFIGWSIVEKAMLVFDWKYGHIPVNPKDNYQLIGYALGAWHTYARDEFRAANVDPSEIMVSLCIEQPRVPGGGGSIIMQADELLAKESKCKDAVQLSLSLTDQDLKQHPQKYLIPGEKQCRWCKAANICTGRYNMLISVFNHVPSADNPHPEPITKERRTEILKLRPMLSKFLQELHAAAFAEALAGMKVPGLKLVMGKHPPRKWRSGGSLGTEIERTLVKLCESAGKSEQDAYKPRAVISPTQAEKLLGVKTYVDRIKEYVDYGDPKPELVDEGDKREPIKPIISAFSNVGEEKAPINIKSEMERVL